VDDAQSLVIPGCDRFVAEDADAHNEMLGALTAFLAVLERTATAHNPRPRAAGELARPDARL
jgi:hypothetical protein